MRRGEGEAWLASAAVSAWRRGEKSHDTEKRRGEEITKRHQTAARRLAALPYETGEISLARKRKLNAGKQASAKLAPPVTRITSKEGKATSAGVNETRRKALHLQTLPGRNTYQAALVYA
jgi:hypothetical protein